MKSTTVLFLIIYNNKHWKRLLAGYVLKELVPVVALMTMGYAVTLFLIEQIALKYH